MIGKILGNRYEIVEKIGGGGMAVVYKAKCNLLNRYVAVKILRTDFTNDKDLIDKFKRESQAAASLSHPNIVNIYDVGEDQEIYYIVMEYVAGKTLKELIKEKGPLEFDEIIDFSKQIAYALRHAHHNHIVHRDIKPHNILVTHDHRAKVTDFGIALAATSSTMTNAGSVIGSVHYFSPEQARGGYTDEKSDLYSLGIVMYEMATGRVPFEGESPISIALKHIQEKPTPPVTYRPDLPQGLSDIMAKLMEKKQSARFQNTEELLVELNQFRKDPHGHGLREPISEVDSPTQVIPAITARDMEETIKERPKPVKEPPQKKKKGVSKGIVISAVLAALLAALLFTFGFFYLGGLLRGSNDVEIPKFIGESKESAESKAAEQELLIEWADGEYNSEVPENYVVDQKPSEGMKVKKGSRITLTLSLGKQQAVVPRLENENEMDIPLKLRDAKLKGERHEEHSDLPIGTVIRQNPQAGEKVQENSTVEYWVSLGPEVEEILMPNLIDMDLERAKITLNNYNLQLGQVSEGYDERYEDNEVIEQSVQPASPVEENTVINLTVNVVPEDIDGEVPGPGEGNGEGQGNGNGNGNGERDPEDITTGAVTKPITVELRDHSGVVNVDLYNVTSGKQKIQSIRHDIDKDGKSINFSVTISSDQVYEIYVNNVYYTDYKLKF